MFGINAEMVYRIRAEQASAVTGLASRALDMTSMQPARLPICRRNWAGQAADLVSVPSTRFGPTANVFFRSAQSC